MQWPPPKSKWFPGYTAHSRGGWVRSYRGHSVWCGNRHATRDEVEATFSRKRAEIDAKGELAGRPKLYREVLSEFLETRQALVDQGRRSRRTLHNFSVVLNQLGDHVGGGTVFASTNRPDVFAAFARKFGGWKSSGFDSVVCRVGTFYRWAVEMEYIDRFRPGPQFRRPPKSEIRDERIDLQKSFTPAEFAKLYRAANPVMRCWLGLGLFAAMNNSEIAHLARSTVDLDAGVVDFRRRKRGKVRRVCPLPAFVVNDLRAYERPEATAQSDADLFFVTRGGHSYGGTRHRDGKPSDMIGRLWAKLETAAGVEHKPRRNFSGLRTTFFNLAPRGQWDLERKVIMGRAQGTVDLDSYLEDVGMDRLRHVVGHVFAKVSTALAGEGLSLPAAFPSVPAESPPQGPPPEPAGAVSSDRRHTESRSGA
jgi:integrase